jgi:hypothetical protein
MMLYRLSHDTVVKYATNEEIQPIIYQEYYFQQTTWHYIPEESALHNHSRGNLKN